MTHLQLLKERAGLAAAGILGCAIWAAIPSTANAAPGEPAVRAESCLSPWATGRTARPKGRGAREGNAPPSPSCRDQLLSELAGTPVFVLRLHERGANRPFEFHHPGHLQLHDFELLRLSGDLFLLGVQALRLGR